MPIAIQNAVHTDAHSRYKYVNNTIFIVLRQYLAYLSLSIRNNAGLAEWNRDGSRPVAVLHLEATQRRWCGLPDASLVKRDRLKAVGRRVLGEVTTEALGYTDYPRRFNPKYPAPQSTDPAMSTMDSGA